MDVKYFDEPKRFLKKILNVLTKQSEEIPQLNAKQINWQSPMTNVGAKTLTEKQAA